MRAQLAVIIDIDGLFEGADHLARLGRHSGKPHRVLGADAKIAVTLFPAGEQRWRAGEINDQVAACLDAVLRGLKSK